MSQNEDKQSKTFDPTPTRIRKARKDGNVFRSQETTAVAMLTVGSTALLVGAPFGFDGLRDMMTYVFLGATQPNLDVAAIPHILRDLGYRAGMLLAPYFAILFVAAISINVIQTGWNLTAKPLEPKGERISPLKGLKRIFSKKGLFTFLKSVLKIAIVGPIAYFSIKSRLPEILLLHTLPIQTILGSATTWIIVLLAQMIIVLIALSAVDFAFEKWRYKEDLKMSFKELKDESKEQEGDPHMKGKRKERARALTRGARLDHAVMSADVVVTNPTHYAVAIRYNPDESPAPRVLAKGIRLRALHMKKLAALHNVPTIEDRALARALYSAVDEQQEIPEDLYAAVAAILAEIFRKRQQN
jgi:flagellar biosynthesis protein FlhB